MGFQELEPLHQQAVSVCMIDLMVPTTTTPPGPEVQLHADEENAVR